MEWLYFILIGLVVGWLAGQIMRGYGFGIIGNIIVGILGAVIGGAVAPVLGLGSGGSLIGKILIALLGAVILLFVIGLFRKK